MKFRPLLFVIALVFQFGLANAGILDLLDKKNDGVVINNGFDKIDATGSNLRNVLVDSPAIDEVIPYGPDYSLIVPVQGGGGLFATYIRKDILGELPKLCTSEWQLNEYQKDLMTGKVTVGFKENSYKDDPTSILTHTVQDPTTGMSGKIIGSRCKGKFDIVNLYVSGGDNQFPQSFLIRHEVPQPNVWKAHEITPANEGQVIADGLLPGKTITKHGYPFANQVAAWGMDLCGKKSGTSRMAVPFRNPPAWLNDGAQMANIPVGVKGISAPTATYFFECSGPNGFVIKGEENSNHLQLIFQAGTTLQAVLSNTVR